MPATAVGSAKGRSMIESNSRSPGTRCRISTQATRKPNTALTAVAMNEAPKLNA